MTNKTEQSRIAYNKTAYEYDASRKGLYTAFHIKELSDTIDLNKDDRVLDIACGNGTLLNKLSKKAKISANGTDISENMIRAAKLRYPDINFAVKSCCPLDWENESFNVITVCCAFHHFENPEYFVNECKRVLKKNGAVYLAEPNFGKFSDFLQISFGSRFQKAETLRYTEKRSLQISFINRDLKRYEFTQRIKCCFLRLKNRNKYNHN